MSIHAYTHVDVSVCRRVCVYVSQLHITVQKHRFVIALANSTA